MNKFTYTTLWLIAASAAHLEPTMAQQLPPTAAQHSQPFTATLSNSMPLVFGMNVGDVSRALGQSLNYISGRPGEEIYLAIGRSGFFNPHGRLYLLFRKGRLAGWKGDWGHNWMWQ